MYRALERPNVLDRLVAFLCDGQHMFFSYVSTAPGFHTDMRPGMREELEGFANMYDERLGQLVNRWLHERLREIEHAQMQIVALRLAAIQPCFICLLK